MEFLYLDKIGGKIAGLLLATHFLPTTKSTPGAVALTNDVLMVGAPRSGTKHFQSISKTGKATVLVSHLCLPNMLSVIYILDESGKKRSVLRQACRGAYRSTVHGVQLKISAPGLLAPPTVI